jgi:DNA anti-recombination protein RmuC
MQTNEPTVDQQTDELARKLTAPMIKAFAKKKARFNSQNRDAWKRMNRPEKEELIQRGGDKILNLIARFKP